MTEHSIDDWAALTHHRHVTVSPLHRCLQTDDEASSRVQREQFPRPTQRSWFRGRSLDPTISVDDRAAQADPTPVHLARDQHDTAHAGTGSDAYPLPVV